MRLLSETEKHPKMSKNGKVGVLSAILHLSPAKSSGYNVCPMASKGCEKACLHYSGMQYSRKYEARIKRTKMFFEQRDEFLAQLHKEIKAHEKKAHKLDLRPNVRLNGTSDIPWENIYYGNRNMMGHFPNIAFHDYTKRTNRTSLPCNYKLVFSRSESNHDDCVKMIENGMNVAIVFAEELPPTYELNGTEYEVIDGDEHDFRFGDYEIYPRPVIVGLVAKGAEARRDETGFIIK